MVIGHEKSHIDFAHFVGLPVFGFWVGLFPAFYTLSTGTYGGGGSFKIRADRNGVYLSDDENNTGCWRYIANDKPLCAICSRSVISHKPERVFIPHDPGSIRLVNGCITAGTQPVFGICLSTLLQGVICKEGRGLRSWGKDLRDFFTKGIEIRRFL